MNLNGQLLLNFQSSDSAVTVSQSKFVQIHFNGHGHLESVDL